MHQKHFPVIDLVATGANIRRLREERGLTVRDLQNYFGFEEPQAIYKWQAGKSLPTVDNLYALSVCLEVPMEDILVERSLRVVYSEPQQKCCGSGRFGEKCCCAACVTYWLRNESSRQSSCCAAS